MKPKFDFDLNAIVNGSDLNELVGAKASIDKRLLEIEAGYVSTKRLGKEERMVLKDAMKKINKRITFLLDSHK